MRHVCSRLNPSASFNNNNSRILLIPLPTPPLHRSPSSKPCICHHSPSPRPAHFTAATSALSSARSDCLDLLGPLLHRALPLPRRPRSRRRHLAPRGPGFSARPRNRTRAASPSPAPPSLLSARRPSPRLQSLPRRPSPIPDPRRVEQEKSRFFRRVPEMGQSRGPEIAAELA
ncbi:uncharacterized protein A4U43_C06F3200 [Asparagus officinalis]|uniref:Uncharacterized protein n=1 Tax=Asparagus officinalis TaxID=4686 RepID=A0A5P1EJ66_ASPOF|nr:uncharacterized protein A4U43_C06F3200 [Asparagus officinalis]